jgi:nitrile hydratase beta subunit
MNGVHDMGGMHDMGPIPILKNEPLFHEPWEARAWALMIACWDLIPKNYAVRFAIEQIPPAEYLRMSYFERWVEALENMLLQAGAIKHEELATGKPVPGSPKGTPALPAAKVTAMIEEDASSAPGATMPPRLQVGQPVRARNMNPIGHTRLPRYARGRSGVIVRDQGVFAFEDSDAAGIQSGKPQHVYQVRFSARELWGEDARAGDAVYLDLWESYLEHT